MTRIFDRNLIVGLALVVVLLFLSIGFAYRNIRYLHDHSRGVARTHQTLVALDRLVSTIKDASLGVTGYLITGELSYLRPYHAAADVVREESSGLRELTRNNSLQHVRAINLQRLVAAKQNRL
jgi:CHASE3 domain sensor protein